ncbi:hypothetical protein ACFQ14_00090 [Pseudahrensia aquimaris]|uniref:SH3 domain-containing protein n=1 Tax=Pseudahrensia aquimaris TaxID=744461 RepID=A0ABW3F8L2_9HYPH
MIRRSILAFSFALLAANASAQEPEFGSFYGGFSLDIRAKPRADFSVDIDHLKGMKTGEAFFSLDWQAVNEDCPRSFDTTFCRILKDASDARAGVDSLGVTIAPNAASIAFKIGNRRQTYELTLRRENGRLQATIIDVKRGIVAEAPVAGRSHLCEQTMCMGNRLDALKANPKQARGVYNDPSFLRTKSRRDARLTPAPPPQSVDRKSFLTGEWEVIGENGDTLGTLGIVVRDGKVLGNGDLMEAAVAGRKLAVRLRDVNVTQDGAHLQITFDEGGSGAKRVAPLLVTLPEKQGGPMRGSLRQGQRFELVTLRYKADYQGGRPPPQEPRPVPSKVPQPLKYMPYSLTGVPAGKRLTLRESPSATSSRIGSLPANTVNLLIKKCEPALDKDLFKAADLAGRKAQLASRWCQVHHVQTNRKGYVKGRYLQPSNY